MVRWSGLRGRFSKVEALRPRAFVGLGSPGGGSAPRSGFRRALGFAAPRSLPAPFSEYGAAPLVGVRFLGRERWWAPVVVRVGGPPLFGVDVVGFSTVELARWYLYCSPGLSFRIELHLAECRVMFCEMVLLSCDVALCVCSRGRG